MNAVPRLGSLFAPSLRTRLLGLVVLAGLTGWGLTSGCGGEMRGTRILWDRWGVPHVFADSSEGLFYAQGWAHARAHGDLVLRLYGEARGRAAEYWGPGDGDGPAAAANLNSDRWVRLMGVPRRAEEWLAAQDRDTRAWLEAFARGFNAYAGAHPEAISDEVEAVLPVQASDVLAHAQRTIQFSFVVHPSTTGQIANTWRAGRAAGGAGASAPRAGSNAWAVAPSHSASGHALLLANPHLPWQGLFTWFELQLTSPEVDAYGASLVGLPILGIGFNDHLGWTHTVNTHDGFDVFEVEKRGEGYLFDGEERPFEVERQTLQIRGADGQLAPGTLDILSTVHGPVIAETETAALALRVVGLGSSGLVSQYWDMARATNLEEFETAQRRLQMPMFTTIYADRDGHILHLFGGETPRRPAGEWNWRGIVPGSTSETLWTEVHSYDELPRVVDPESGWVQNANDPPWTTTFPAALSADDYPAYMAPRFMHFRAQSSARMLAEDSDGVTFEELLEYKHSTRMELAERILDDLEAAVEAHGSDEARRAMEVLSAWDRRADTDSRGAVLFAAFASAMNRAAGASSPFAEPWSEAEPRATPDGLADPARAVAILEAVAAAVEQDHGSLDPAWGDLHRFRRGIQDLAANGAPGSLGVFRVIGYRPTEDSKLTAAQGDSFVAAVEFSDPVRAQALITYGNSSQPGSPHLGDQLALASRQELRPVWRSADEIRDHLELEEKLDPALEVAP